MRPGITPGQEGLKPMDYLHDSHRAMFAKLLPSAIGAMLSETVASLIDTIILTHYLGLDMLSTVSVCMPICSSMCCPC